VASSRSFLHNDYAVTAPRDLQTEQRRLGRRPPVHALTRGWSISAQSNRQPRVSAPTTVSVPSTAARSVRRRSGGLWTYLLLREPSPAPLCVRVPSVTLRHSAVGCTQHYAIPYPKPPLRRRDPLGRRRLFLQVLDRAPKYQAPLPARFISTFIRGRNDRPICVASNYYPRHSICIYRSSPRPICQLGLTQQQSTPRGDSPIKDASSLQDELGSLRSEAEEVCLSYAAIFSSSKSALICSWSIPLLDRLFCPLLDQRGS